MPRYRRYDSPPEYVSSSQQSPLDAIFLPPIEQENACQEHLLPPKRRNRLRNLERTRDALGISISSVEWNLGQSPKSSGGQNLRSSLKNPPPAGSADRASRAPRRSGGRNLGRSPKKIPRKSWRSGGRNLESQENGGRNLERSPKKSWKTMSRQHDEISRRRSPCLKKTSVVARKLRQTEYPSKPR